MDIVKDYSNYDDSLDPAELMISFLTYQNNKLISNSPADSAFATHKILPGQPLPALSLAPATSATAALTSPRSTSCPIASSPHSPITIAPTSSTTPK